VGGEGGPPRSAFVPRLRTRHGAGSTSSSRSGGIAWGIEVKASADVRSGDLRWLEAFADRHPRVKRCVVVFFGPRRRKAGGVELVPVDGAVLAYVFDAQGVQVSADAADDAELKIDVGAEAAAQELELAWDAEAGAYRTDLSGEVDVQVQPVNVFFTSGGAQHRGRIVHVRHGLGGGVRVAAGAEGGIQATGVDVLGPRGRVSVMGGVAAPGVRVRTPSAMVAVRAEAPSVMVRSRTGANVRVGAGGVSVMTPGPPSGMVSAMASGGVSIGGGGGIRIGN